MHEKSPPAGAPITFRRQCDGTLDSTAECGQPGNRGDGGHRCRRGWRGEHQGSSDTEAPGRICRQRPRHRQVQGRRVGIGYYQDDRLGHVFRGTGRPQGRRGAGCPPRPGHDRRSRLGRTHAGADGQRDDVFRARQDRRSRSRRRMGAGRPPPLRAVGAGQRPAVPGRLVHDGRPDRPGVRPVVPAIAVFRDRQRHRCQRRRHAHPRERRLGHRHRAGLGHHPRLLEHRHRRCRHRHHLPSGPEQQAVRRDLLGHHLDDTLWLRLRGLWQRHQRAGDRQRRLAGRSRPVRPGRLGVGGRECEQERAVLRMQ